MAVTVFLAGSDEDDRYEKATNIPGSRVRPLRCADGCRLLPTRLRIALPLKRRRPPPRRLAEFCEAIASVPREPGPPPGLFSLLLSAPLALTPPDRKSRTNAAMAARWRLSESSLTDA